MCLAAFIMWLSNKGRADPLFLIKKIKSWVFAPLFLWKRVKSWVFGYWQVCWLYYGWLWVTANWVLLRVNTDKHWQTPTNTDKHRQLSINFNNTSNTSWIFDVPYCMIWIEHFISQSLPRERHLLAPKRTPSSSRNANTRYLTNRVLWTLELV